MKNILPALLLVLFSVMQSKAQTKNLWASATTGGAYGFGTILKGDSDGTNFTVVHSFDSVNGSYPIGKMAMAGNGIVYCITELGGCQDSCTICCYNPATDSFSMINQFFLDVQEGGVPYSGVITGSNGLLYGTTTEGGANSDGTIYTIDPTTNTHTDVYDFNEAAGTGFNPLSEMVQASDGNMYGIAVGDGGESAVLYSFNPSDNNYVALYNLGVAYIYTGYNLALYHAPNLLQATDHKIYGLFSNAATGNALFSYDLTSGTYTSLHVFSSTDGIPLGSMVQAGNGLIYGTTIDSVGTGNGKIFSYDPASATFTGLRTFDSTTGFCVVGGLGTYGNTKIIGSTLQGGLYQYGTLFTYDFTTGAYADIFDFDSTTTGAGPLCDVLKTGFKTTTGIPVIANAPLHIFPNPASDVLYIQNGQPDAPFSITNALGQQVSKGVLTGNRQALDISQLPAGAYLINKVGFVKE
jgi:uncharacterized repeat protein (TIGR03803 family)